MKVKRLHINLAGFVLLLVLMVFINNKIEKSEQSKAHQTEMLGSIDFNNNGIAPLLAQVPNRTEGSLPIKLLTNPNTNFLYFVNTGFDFKNDFTYLMLRKRFIKYAHKIQRNKLLSYLVTAKNKDIQ